MECAERASTAFGAFESALSFVLNIRVTDVRIPRLSPFADNKRLDEWVKSDRILGYYAADDEDDEEGGAGAGGRGRGGRKKKDLEHGGHHEDGHGHEAMDPQTAALEREHEEITKVRYNTRDRWFD